MTELNLHELASVSGGEVGLVPPPTFPQPQDRFEIEEFLRRYAEQQMIEEMLRNLAD